MKIVLLLSSRTWEYKLRASRVAPGQYYVSLRGLAGEALQPAAITGSFPSLEAVVVHAETIYLQLVAMREESRRDRTAAAVLESPSLTST